MVPAGKEPKVKPHWNDEIFVGVQKAFKSVMFSLQVESEMKKVFSQASQQVSQSIVEEDLRPNTAQ